MVFVKVPEIFPAPELPIPVTVNVLFLVQANTVPVVLPEKTIVEIAVPEQTVCESGEPLTSGVGFTITVAVIGSPSHPSAWGTMVKVTVTGAVPLFIKLPLILPLPLLPMVPVMPGLSLVQLYVVPGVALDKTIVVILLPLHEDWLAGVATATGDGFTTTVAVPAGPKQPLAVPVIENVTVIGLAVLFTSVPEIFPLPLLPIVPVTPGLSLVQLKLAPLTELVEEIVLIFPPEQIVCEAGVGTASGEGLTKTVAVIGDPSQPLAVGVMVKVTSIAVFVLFTRFPVILPVPLVKMVPVTAGLSRVQLKVVFRTAPLKLILLIFTPEHAVWF